MTKLPHYLVPRLPCRSVRSGAIMEPATGRSRFQRNPAESARFRWIQTMANKAQRWPSNVPGEFYVDRTCIDCDQCREIAPATFGDG